MFQYEKIRLQSPSNHNYSLSVGIPFNKMQLKYYVMLNTTQTLNQEGFCLMRNYFLGTKSRPKESVTRGDHYEEETY